MARGTLIGKAGYPGAPVPVPLPGPQAAGPVPVVPAHDLTVSCRVFTRVMTGMRKGQMPPPHPSQAGTGFAGYRDDLFCGPRSVPPRVLPFRRWRMISRHVPGAAATPRALCAAGAWLATRAARRCIPASLLQAGPLWPLPPLAGSAGQAAGGRRKDCRRCTGLPQATSVSRTGNTVLHRRAFARRTGSSRPSAS